MLINSRVRVQESNLDYNVKLHGISYKRTSIYIAQYITLIYFQAKSLTSLKISAYNRRLATTLRY